MRLLARALALSLAPPLLGSPGPAAAAPPGEAYRLPPAELVERVDLPAAPRLVPSPDGAHALVVEPATRPALAELARGVTVLAGVAVEPRAAARAAARPERGLALVALADGARAEVPLPDGTRLGAVRWSPSGARFAFTLVGPAGTELWLASVDAPDRPVRAADALTTVTTDGFAWLPDGERLLATRLPTDRGERPVRPAVPDAPIVRRAEGRRSPPARAPGLLADRHDAALFDFLARAQLTRVDAAEPLDPAAPVALTALGEPGVLTAFEPSPDGEHVLVTRLRPPHARHVPLEGFARSIEVWGAGGEREHVVAELRPRDDALPAGRDAEPRRVHWRPDAPATLVWAEAGRPSGEGVAGAARARGDRWLASAAPFEAEPAELVRLEGRAESLDWPAGGGAVVARETLAAGGEPPRVRATWFELAEPFGSRVLEDRPTDDRYADPGELVTLVDGRGQRVVRRDGEWVYRRGEGAGPAGARPFLDRQNVRTLAVERLWRCAPGSYEVVVDVLLSGTERPPAFVTRYESPAEPPSFRVRDVARPAATRTLVATAVPRPGPRAAGGRVLTYERDDGVRLAATLHTPPGYALAPDGAADAAGAEGVGGRLPLLVWTRPIERARRDAAGQLAGSPYRFTRGEDALHLDLVACGYAVLDGVPLPLVGDAAQVEATRDEQLASSLRAAVDRAVELGVADPERVAVGGRGAGAAAALWLLANTSGLRAGVALGGCFDSSPVSHGAEAGLAPPAPWLHADRIEAPLLLIHGTGRGNGVAGARSRGAQETERVFDALAGAGGSVRLVLLPREGPLPRARESVLHALAEMSAWLAQHSAPPRGARVEAGFPTEDE